MPSFYLLVLFNGDKAVSQYDCASFSGGHDGREQAVIEVVTVKSEKMSGDCTY